MKSKHTSFLFYVNVLFISPQLSSNHMFLRSDLTFKKTNKLECMCEFSASWWGRAISVVLHRCSCCRCHRRGDATSLLKSGQWYHSWEYSKHTYTINEYTSPPSPLIPFPPYPPFHPHQKLYPLAFCNIIAHHQLVASLPFKEELSGGAVGHAGLVVPHQIPTHELTVVSRMQRGIQQEGVVLRTDTHIDRQMWGKHITYEVKNKKALNKQRYSRITMYWMPHVISHSLILVYPISQPPTCCSIFMWWLQQKPFGLRTALNNAQFKCI